MKTNFQLIKDLDAFTPRERGILDSSEVAFIKTTLCLDEMDELGLRNLRDMVVMVYDRKMDDGNAIVLMDKLSGITAVIDSVLFAKGCEV